MAGFEISNTAMEQSLIHLYENAVQNLEVFGTQLRNFEQVHSIQVCHLQNETNSFMDLLIRLGMERRLLTAQENTAFHEFHSEVKYRAELIRRLERRCSAEEILSVTYRNLCNNYSRVLVDTLRTHAAHVAATLQLIAAQQALG